MNEATDEIIDRLSDAVIVVDGSSRVIRSNAAAEHLFEQGDPIRSSGGRLHIASQVESQLEKLDGKSPALIIQGYGNHRNLRNNTKMENLTKIDKLDNMVENPDRFEKAEF